MRWLDDILALAGTACISVGAFLIAGAGVGLVATGALLLAAGFLVGRDS